MTTFGLVSTREVADRHSLCYLRKLQPDTFDFLLFLPSIFLPCALGHGLKLIGPLFLFLPILCLLYAALRLTVPPRLLSTYIVFCLLVASLSSYQLFPKSWQIYFMQEAIVRQIIPVLTFFAIAWASKAYFQRRLKSENILFGIVPVIFLGFITAPVVMFLQGVSYQGDDPASSVLAMYGAFINNVLITMFFVLGCVFLRRGWQRYTGLITILVIAATTHFAQFRLVAICALAALLGAPGRIITLGLISALTASYLLGISHVPEAMVASPNSGIRLAFVADALSSVADTSGIGIGYGTESVKWRYRFPNMPDFTFLPDPASITPDRMLELLSTGVHNSFVQALLRTGVAGFLLFLAAFFAAFPPRELPRDLRNHAAVVFWMAFLACFVNPALESPVQVVGVGFIYGYLLALRGWAGARHLALTRRRFSSETLTTL